MPTDHYLPRVVTVWPNRTLGGQLFVNPQCTRRGKIGPVKSACGKVFPRAWHCSARTTGKPEADSPTPDSGLIGLLDLKSSGAERSGKRVIVPRGPRASRKLTLHRRIQA